MKATYGKVVALALVALALSVTSFSQSFSTKVRADIPFSFYAGDKLLPAGSYTFGFNSNNHSLAVLSNQKGKASFLVGYPSAASKTGMSLLVFRTNSDGAHALEEIQGANYSVGFDARKELAKVAE